MPRKKILENMWTEGLVGFDSRETTEIADMVNMPAASALLVLEDMMMLDLIERQREQGVNDDDEVYWSSHKKKGRQPYRWKLADKTVDLIKASELFKF